MNALTFLLISGFLKMQGYLGITLPSGETREIIKSGGCGGVQVHFAQLSLVSIGFDINSTSGIISGTGNSSIKLFSVSPDLCITPPVFHNAIDLHAIVLLTKMYCENPSFKTSDNLVGAAGEASVRITEKPVKLFLMGKYSQYRGNTKVLEWFTIGFKLGF